MPVESVWQKAKNNEKLKLPLLAGMQMGP